MHHGGDMIGYHSDMMWLPEHGVGAVILTNGDPGWLIRRVFRRKLLEVLFDGADEADAQVAAAAKSFREQLAAERKLLTVPADPAEAGKLASRYAHPAVGGIAVRRTAAGTVFSDAAGTMPANGAIVTITDSGSTVVNLTANAAGNFYTNATLVPPLTISIASGSDTAAMSGSLTIAV